MTLIVDSYHGDTSKTSFSRYAFPLTLKKKIMTEECLRKGIGSIIPWSVIGDIGATIQEYAEARHIFW